MAAILSRPQSVKWIKVLWLHGTDITNDDVSIIMVDATCYRISFDNFVGLLRWVRCSCEYSDGLRFFYMVSDELTCIMEPVLTALLNAYVHHLPS